MKYNSLSIAGIKQSTSVKQVDVCRSTTVRVDDEFYMVPSQGYAGVELGAVTVVAIGSPDQLYEEGNIGDLMAHEIASEIGEFTEIDLSAYDEFTEEYTDRQELLSQGLWVVYKYAKSTSSDTLVFPIEEFLDHSVRMF